MAGRGHAPRPNFAHGIRGCTFFYNVNEALHVVLVKEGKKTFFKSVFFSLKSTNLPVNKENSQTIYSGNIFYNKNKL